MGVMYKLAKSRNSELAVESFLKELSAAPLFCKWIYVFDLAQIPFLTQSSHLSRIYTTTRRTLACRLYFLPELNWGSFTCWGRCVKLYTMEPLNWALSKCDKLWFHIDFTLSIIKVEDLPSQCCIWSAPTIAQQQQQDKQSHNLQVFSCFGVFLNSYFEFSFHFQCYPNTLNP